MASNFPEWESNKDAPNCRLCSKPFSFTTRRHHCRSCGRVVCNPCSSKRLILNQLIDNDKRLSRVCDDCYKSLTTRKALEINIKSKKIHDKELLQMSSIVSDELVRVFLLDGSFKVVSYDDNTTALELTSNVCYSVNVALFETIDIVDTDQFKFISCTENVVDIISRWKLNNITNAKLVIPIYDMDSCGKDRIPPSYRIVKGNASKDLVSLLDDNDNNETIRTPNQSPSRSSIWKLNNKILKGDKSNNNNNNNNNGSSNSNHTTSNNDGNNIEQLKQKLIEITEKYEMATLILRKRGVSDNDIGTPSSSATSASAYTTPIKARPSTVSISSSTSYLYKKVSNSSSKSVLDTPQSSSSLNDNVISPYKSLETLAIMGREDIIIATNTNDLSLLLRTFFYQLNGIENFCFRYESIIRSIITGTVNDDSNSDSNGSIDHNITLDLVTKTPQMFLQLYEMASALENLFELLQSFSVTFNLDVKKWLLESLKRSLKLRNNVSDNSNADIIVNILHCLDREQLGSSDEVKKIISNFIDECFYGANMMQTCEYTTPQILAMLERIQLLLHLISDELVAVLPSFDLMHMYEERFFKILRDDITTFYFTNRQNICLNDLLKILAFVESQDRKLESLGIDTTMIKELGSDIEKKLIISTQTNLQQLLTSLHDNDEKTSPQQMQQMNSNDSQFRGLGSKWPQELLTYLEETLTSISTYLQSPTREKVYQCVLNTLPELLTKQSGWLKKVEGNSYTREVSIERLCASMNNHHYFSEMLEERKHSLLSKSETEEEVGQCFSKVILLYTVSPALSASILSQLMSSDIKDILKAGLFKSGYENSVGSQFGGSKVITIVATAMAKNKNDLQSYLCPDNIQKFFKTIMADMLSSLTETFLELLLLTLTSVTHNLLLKIDEDYHIIQSLCLQYKDCFKDSNHENITLLPLCDVVQVFKMDTRNMASFVRENLYVDFGNNAVRVWQTIMTIRGETKSTVDAVYDSVMRGWSPQEIKPLNECKFKDKLRKTR